MGTPFVSIQEILSQAVSSSTGLFLSESPIEDIMAGLFRKFKIKTKQQVKIGHYRVDILLETKYLKIIVECDGAEFHKNKKKEKIRDEYLENKGYRIFHFTGSEIVKSRLDCAHKVVEWISEIYATNEYQEYLMAYEERKDRNYFRINENADIEDLDDLP